jgi:transcriptional regulator of acetoin/glycerol metabolism
MSQHADKVYSVAREKSAAASSPIAASWRRCMTMHRLRPEDRSDPVQLSEAAFRAVVERSGHVIEEASAELDRLFALIGKSGCCLVLTDHEGVILERRGEPGDDKDFRDVGLWSGALWSEASAGTNGIGTALAEERPMTIFRDQHFRSANIGLSCTSVPVRDHKGGLAGAIDISTARRDATELVMPILSQAARDTALRIELNLFRRAYANARIILVPGATLGGSALLAVDKDDLVLGATRAARLALKLDDRKIAAGIPASDALSEERGGETGDLLEAERAALRRALSRNGGNVSLTAQLLGMSRATLHRKINRLGLRL